MRQGVEAYLEGKVGHQEEKTEAEQCTKQAAGVTCGRTGRAGSSVDTAEASILVHRPKTRPAWAQGLGKGTSCKGSRFMAPSRRQWKPPAMRVAHRGYLFPPAATLNPPGA